MDFDFTILLENTESIVAVLVAILTLASTVVLAFGKAKTAKKLKDAAGLIGDLAEGITKASTAISKATKKGKTKPEVTDVVTSHLEEKGSKELFDEVTKTLEGDK